MIEKEFTPYELALELKQLGFDEPCFGFYQVIEIESENKSYLVKVLDVTQSVCRNQDCTSPTYSQAFRWFREKYDIHYSIDRECSQHDYKWGYNWSIYNYTGLYEEYLTSHPDAPAGEWVYKTYEDAERACLKKLIEIVKEK